MSEHASPQEKLLKLIRRKEKAAPLKKGSSPLPKAESVFISTGSLFRTFDKALILGIIFLSIYVGYEFFFTNKDIGLVMKEAKKSLAQTEEKGIVLSEPRLYSYYADVVRARDIFESPIYGNNVKKTEEIKSASSLPELMRGLKLVGIILDANSQAIIEDSQSGQTFFLHKGEQINNATVEDIEEGKVTLLYGGQRVELVP